MCRSRTYIHIYVCNSIIQRDKNNYTTWMIHYKQTREWVCIIHPTPSTPSLPSTPSIPKDQLIYSQKIWSNVSSCFRSSQHISLLWYILYKEYITYIKLKITYLFRFKFSFLIFFYFFLLYFFSFSFSFVRIVFSFWNKIYMWYCMEIWDVEMFFDIFKCVL